MKAIESIKLSGVTWVWKHTPNCAEMSRLASERLDQPLPLKLRLGMRLHYLICVWCRRYSQHLRFLHRNAPHLNESLLAFARWHLSAAAKQRIIQHLRRMHGS
jgi:hypothetical protein